MCSCPRDRRAQTSELPQEPDDTLEGLLTKASRPWVRGRMLGGMDEVVSERVHLVGEPFDAYLRRAVIQGIERCGTARRCEAHGLLPGVVTNVVECGRLWLKYCRT
jgi:hypothetical protein